MAAPRSPPTVIGPSSPDIGAEAGDLPVAPTASWRRLAALGELPPLSAAYIAR
jgi:hypothetical protein